MAGELIGHVAVVCGSTQGIGKAVAMELARRGASIALVARNADSLARARSELPAVPSQEHTIWVADFQDLDQVTAVSKALANAVPTARILVNNTGGPPPGPVLNADLLAFNRAFQNHLICNHLFTQALVPGMRGQGYGRIVNIISTSVKQPIPGLGVSNTIRGAVASWAKTLAAELGPFGITVNNVLPGYTRTARLDSLIQSKAREADISEEELIRRMQDEIPARRFAESSEIAAAVAFLVSSEAGYVNGINLPVDGGRTLCL